jgi:hypothetical protein
MTRLLEVTMTMRTLLLGAAAGLVSVAGAQAADVPMDKAEAVEYVKVCTEFGAGFFYIPGTDTCLKLSGRVDAYYQFADDLGKRTNDVTSFGHLGRINFDARSATDLGTLRSFIELNATSSGAKVGKAFIQLGGLTAGFAASAYNFYDTNYGNTIFSGYYAPSVTTNLLSYTATFGGGFYATLSIEDNKVRRGTINAGNQVVSAAPNLYASGGTGYAGQQIPDIVAAIGASQSWGNAQIMAAAHQIRYTDMVVDTNGTVAGGTASGHAGDDYGFAVGAGVGIDLPFAAGGRFAIEANYADGALSYLGATALGPDSYQGVNTSGVISSDNSKGYAIASEFQVGFSPSLTGTLFGSYANVDIGNGGFSNQVDNVESYILGANLVYTVVKGLTVGAEVSYSNTDTAYVSSTGSSVDAFAGGIRIQRDF